MPLVQNRPIHQELSLPRSSQSGRTRDWKDQQAEDHHLVFREEGVHNAINAKDHLGDEDGEEESPVANKGHQDALLDALSQASRLTEGWVDAVDVSVILKDKGAS